MQPEPNLKIVQSELSEDTLLFLDALVHHVEMMRIEIAELRRSNDNLANLLADKLE